MIAAGKWQVAARKVHGVVSWIGIGIVYHRPIGRDPRPRPRCGDVGGALSRRPGLGLPSPFLVILHSTNLP